MSFFDPEIPADFVQAEPAPYGKPRTLTASALRLDLRGKSTRKEIARPTARVMQEAAWDYYESIGEIKFAFNLVASVMGRIRFFPGIIGKRTEPPVEISEWKDDKPVESQSVNELEQVATEALDKLNDGFNGGLSEMARSFTLNASVAGEMFLVQPASNRYVIASTSELTSDNGVYQLKSNRDSSKGQKLKKDTYVARIWRNHPRYRMEPDSSMFGVLDQCEKLQLLDRSIRSTARSRMHANMMFIPQGIQVASISEEESEEEALENTIIEALSAPVTDESSAYSIVPVMLRGPADLGEKIRLIEVGRMYDEQLMAATQDALGRVLSGIDVPKDVVTGLANVKYANAIVLSDDLYRAHVEPLCLMLCDALTSVYLRPYLAKAGLDPAMIERAVVWYDPSMVVTRPDRSTAANEGHDRMTISDKAWRGARGFSEEDAPNQEEMLRRLAFEKGTPPADTLVALIQHFSPEVFDAIRKASRGETGMPDEVSSLIDGEAPTEEPIDQPAAVENTTPPVQPGGPEGEGGAGGNIAPGGTRPPSATRVPVSTGG